MLPLSAAPALALHDVSKRYGRRWALARLTYALPAGRSLLLTGHNGSGKTTLLRLLATALSPTAGRVEVLGRDAVVERDAVRRDVALLSHASFLYEDLTAHQNLTVLARLLGLPSPADAASDELTRVGLSRRSDSPVRSFSAGMRKRRRLPACCSRRRPSRCSTSPSASWTPRASATWRPSSRSSRPAASPSSWPPTSSSKA
ncbi:ATP-binding cassette domain-containing protein [Myxococcus sp. MxC21-1]|uniref:ABC transporter ATP-binding protein n=1 Tax=Myxococcus sp. MxC21-1 TaxID=3041439 RepID=UPI002B2EB518|nr:ATP-binding cassette domain-containing protein [Myxococcus sp. MxC21-1]